jgi:methyltransferase (TIGR00027 family)
VLATCGAVARCERITVPADLRADWPARLTAARFDPTQRAAWLAEGLLIYLTPGEAERLLTAVTGLSAPGSRLAIGHNRADRDALTARAEQIPWMRAYTTLWRGGLADPPGWLTDHGWRPEFHGLAAVSSSYGRPTPGPTSSGFLTAVRGTGAAERAVTYQPAR